ncbi:methyltransferase, partial [bacterium]|nr:methyltransferase [bacterium]
GWGAIGIVAALINQNGHLVLTDIDSRAEKVAADNVHRLGLQDRVSVLATDDVSQINGSFDLILSNPPFHADTVTLVNLFKAASDKLRKKGSIYVVVEKTYLSKLKKVLEQTFRHVKVYYEDMNTNFFVLVSRK